ncbi:MAG TPA: molybdenum cofactor biosynthesis protein MoaE [Bacteroidota bacterium]|nr:molybdenum cofactor biosynthesis protein MoaE [Bacteroidota bacterium]
MLPILVDIVDGRIDTEKLVAGISDPSAGGTAVFIGTTRTPSGNREVEYLEYEAYRPMALKQMAAIAETARSRWPLVGVCAVHRVGRVGIGETSVVIAVSAVHRAAAFEACRFIIDAVKKDAPIWKKEVFADGHAWVGP